MTATPPGGRVGITTMHVIDPSGLELQFLKQIGRAGNAQVRNFRIFEQLFLHNLPFMSRTGRFEPPPEKKPILNHVPRQIHAINNIFDGYPR